MKASYNAETRKFTVIWKDYYKEFKGSKSPYGRKMEAWKDSRRDSDKSRRQPTKKEIALKIAELEEYGRQQEELSKAKLRKLSASADGITHGDTSDGVNAVLYLTDYDEHRISRSNNKHTLSYARNAIRRFREFLEAKHPFIALHQIKKPIIEEWAKYYNRYSYSVLKMDFIYLRVMFDKVIEEYEESPIKYVNHIRKFDLLDLTTKTANEREAFTVEQLQGILDYFTETQMCHKNESARCMRYQRFFVFYFAMVTGWRIGDILSLTWEQVNMDDRTIYMKHSKTCRSTQAETLLFITPLMERVLIEQKKLHESYPYHKNLVFNYRRYFYEHDASLVRSEATGLADIIKKLVVRKKWSCCTTTEYGHNLSLRTIHSIRKTVITELSLFGSIDGERIKYLVGHAQKSTSGKFYMKFKQYPERATRDMVEHMELLINAQFYLNKLLYGDSVARGSYADVVMPYGWQTNLIQNFWDKDAIAEIERRLSLGQPPQRIFGFIKKMNEYRLSIGEREVSMWLINMYNEKMMKRHRKK